MLLERMGRHRVKSLLMTYRNRALAFVLLSCCLCMLLATTSCSSNEAKAKKVIEEYLKNQGITNLALDFFYTDRNFPDKAYASATVTYNFASSQGNPQREFLGFILAREGDGWRIERATNYTKEPQRAAVLLAGRK